MRKGLLTSRRLLHSRRAPISNSTSQRAYFKLKMPIFARWLPWKMWGWFIELVTHGTSVRKKIRIRRTTYMCADIFVRFSASTTSTISSVNRHRGMVTLTSLHVDSYCLYGLNMNWPVSLHTGPKTAGIYITCVWNRSGEMNAVCIDVRTNHSMI